MLKHPLALILIMKWYLTVRVIIKKTLIKKLPLTIPTIKNLRT